MKVFRIIKNLLTILAETAFIRKLVMGILSALVLWYIFSTIVSIGSWKAVFIDNNQVFFGKFVDVPFARTVTLRNVFYIQTPASQNGTTTYQVSRIVNDVQGPLDKMIISKDHILYFEVLRSTSPFVKGLDKEVSNQGK